MPATSGLIHLGTRMFGLSESLGHSENIFREQVRLLYSNAYTGLLVNLVVATAAIGVMWQHAPFPVLFTWAAALLLVIAARAALTAMCLRLPASECDARTWARRYLYGSFSSGIIWGAMGLILELHGTHSEHGFAAYILGGMAAGAIATNGALPSAYLSFMLPTLLPMNLMLYLRGDGEHLLIGVLTSFFIVVLLITFGRHHRVVRNSIFFRFEKDQALQELQRAHRQLHDMTADLAEGLFVLDSKGQSTFMNPEAQRLLGWRMEELRGRRLHDLIHLHSSGEKLPEQRCGVIQALQNRDIQRRDDELFQRKDGTSFPVAYIAAPMTLPDGESAVVVSFQDISDRKAMEEQLSHLATHDGLTGLYNRRELERLLGEETARATRYQRPLSALMLDVDHFKQVNDTYGHDVGDQVLRQLSDRIRQNIRTADIATRYGGEEFVVILPETPINEAIAAAERLREAVATSPFPLADGRQLDIRISLGVANTTGDRTGAPDLIKAADAALYRAKESGRNRVCAA